MPVFKSFKADTLDFTVQLLFKSGSADKLMKVQKLKFEESPALKVKINQHSITPFALYRRAKQYEEFPKKTCDEQILDGVF